MARARRWTASAALLGSMFIARGIAATVQEDLANESKVLGLALTWMEGGTIVVRHLDRDDRHSESVPGLDYLYDIEPVSQSIFGLIRQSSVARSGTLPALPQFALFRLGVGPTTVLDRPRGAILAVLSSNAERLAVLTASGTNLILLQYGDLAWTSVHLVYSREAGRDREHPEDVAENFGWAPDSLKLVYAKDHAVYIFDTRTGASSFLAQGSDPAWSPDGRFIAYVSPRHQLILHDMADHQTVVTSGEMDVIGYPRWSPDSKFVLFTRWDRLKATTSPFAYYFLHDATDIMALRVADRQPAVLFDPRNGMDTRHVYWIETRSGR
jgi:WD40 repeat protein